MARKILTGIIVGTTVPLSSIGLEGAVIEDVYTILNPTRFFNGFDPHTGKPRTYNIDDVPLLHGHNVFVEDKGHDWNTFLDKFRYNTHAAPYGSEQSILIEYNVAG